MSMNESFIDSVFTLDTLGKLSSRIGYQSYPSKYCHWVDDYENVLLAGKIPVVDLDLIFYRSHCQVEFFSSKDNREIREKIFS
ncbi:hypothetical protein PPL_07617 [Heterostelium album PN500]|uniref:Uncharacterized protein n=1 Tax=Heterostelium pallidum (strain ATCC 26659 / Pp 5 / PN500) TaxID=670386 RepID=D3BGG6_HETP5|nr:hypothetical protein PPL_07617 [Heterostelium album PN500]EFA79566.1 hypothetical protein PPL_07617 [Heterostelium album PN500]|eukprot:XP_020431687.1 hypothetical protein PPL_07617 [Heterostelium album PN500]